MDQFIANLEFLLLEPLIRNDKGELYVWIFSKFGDLLSDFN